MLLQEQTQEQTTGSAPMPSAELASAPPTPREVAQAMLAVESRTENSAPHVDSEYAERTVESLSLDMDPKELLAQVQKQRLHAHQDSVMTKRRRWDRITWVFLGGMVAAGAAAMFLAFTTYLLYTKFLEMSHDQMQRNAQDAAKSTRMVSPQDQVKAWSFPMAQQNSLSTGSTTASASMTAKSPYLSVWKYYTQETGYTKIFPNLPFPIPINGSVPNLSANWTTTENSQPVNYKIESHGSGGHPIAYFTEHAGPNTVTVILTPGAVENSTEITIYAMNAE